MYASQIHFLTSGIWKFLVCSPFHWPSATKNEKILSVVYRKDGKEPFWNQFPKCSIFQKSRIGVKFSFSTYVLLDIFFVFQLNQANSNSPFCPSAFFSRGYLILSLICAFFSSANLSKNSDSESFSYRVIRLCLICIHVPQFG